MNPQLSIFDQIARPHCETRPGSTVLPRTPPLSSAVGTPSDPGRVEHFDGSTYDPQRDQSRLQKQLTAVRQAMADGRWRTLHELAELTGHPEASVSARLRDLRKPRFGGFTVDRRRRSPGTFEYRVVPA